MLARAQPPGPHATEVLLVFLGGVGDCRQACNIQKVSVTLTEFELAARWIQSTDLWIGQPVVCEVSIRGCGAVYTR